MSSWHSPGSIYNVGHAAVNALFDGRTVTVQEKVDGSFFAFGVFSGELKCRSKGAALNIDAPEGRFAEAVATAKRLAPLLHDDWTYRGEYLKKPRHNGLAYNRVPLQHVILFDIATGEEDFVDYALLRAEGTRLGLDVVPELYQGPIITAATLSAFLERESVLGGQKIEGVVIKPLSTELLFGRDKKRLAAKFVSEAFKEVQAKAWKADNPKGGDILDMLARTYCAPTRWSKAVQHLRERGELEESPRDIPKLMAEVQADVRKECEDEIRDKLFGWAWKQRLGRAVTAGLPEWWKNELVKSAFADHDAA